MSSPNNEGGPPPDPPHPPDAPLDTTTAGDAPQVEAGPSTPQPSVPPVPTVEDELEASRPDSGAEAAQQPSENTNTTPNPTQSPPQHQGRRPLYSVTQFIPMGPRPGEGGPGNGDRVGFTWTLEVFANDGEGDEDHPTDQNDRPQPAGANAEGADGSAAAAVLAAAEAEAAAREAGTAGAADNQNATGAPNAPNTEGNGNGAANGTERAERRNMIFILGPDGLIPRPGQEDAGPAPFAFPFPFLPFMMQPAGPDPAKAAELLASLPTVRRALLRRVDKVVAAEDASNGKEYDERGWRCGICLEGIEEEPAEGPIPVKALPCNHLFHGPCLEPWFSSHHTCPTCRLDLDPLRTLNDPRETRRNPLRPAPTGSGRGTPAGGQPYARGRGRDRSGLQSGQQTPAEAEGQEPQTPQGTQDEPPTPPGLMELARITAQNLARGLFGGLTTGSPLPMDRDLPQERERTPMGPERPPGMQPAHPAAAGPASGSDTPAHTPGSATAAGSPNAGGRPTPERRSHISVIHLGPPPFGHRPFAAPPNPFQHLFGQPPGAGATDEGRPAENEGAPQANQAEQSNTTQGSATSEAEAPAASAAAEQPVSAADPSTSDAASAEPSARAATPAPQGEQAATPAGEPNRESANATPAPANDGDNAPRRPFRGFPLELLFLQMGAPEPPAPPAPEERPASTFVPQSLESWTEQREKTLGWRCDAVECLVAPPVPDGDGEDMDVDEPPAEDVEEEVLPAADKEMLSIYSAQQPLFPPSAEGEEAHANADFVLLTCPHRWHRTCLEVAERSAGHSGLPDGEGRQWVRCMTCRKEGWVVPRTPTPPQPEAVTADV